MESIFKHISEHLGLGDPVVAKELEFVFEQHHETLMPKFGNFLGHICEFAHFNHLRKQGFKVVKHPTGQKMAPDLEGTYYGKTYWVEDKNCSAGSYGKIVNNCVPLRNYKHSYRNKEENSFFYSLSLFALVPFHIANIICLLLALGFITFVGYAIVSLLAIGQIYFIYLVLTDLFNIKITVGK